MSLWGTRRHWGMLNGPSTSYPVIPRLFSRCREGRQFVDVARVVLDDQRGLEIATIPFSRSIEASVCERSELNRGTPLLS